MVWRPSTSRRRVGGEGLGIPSLHLGCHVAALVVNFGSGTCYAGFAGMMLSSRVLFCCLQAQDARHHGRYEPEGL